MPFEWDERKDRINREKHGVSFQQATKVFSDPSAIELVDARQGYGEERFVRIGRYGSRILRVVFTIREEKVRIITARKASKSDREDYFYYRQLHV